MSKEFLQNLSDILKVSRDSPILLLSKDGGTAVGTYSSYHSVVMTCEAELDDFSVVVSNEVARQLQRSLSADKLAFGGKDTALVAQSKGVRLTVATLNEPLTMDKLLTKYKDTVTHEVSGDKLNEAISMVKSSANDKSIGDVVLRGYHMHTDNGLIELMASNGSVLTSVVIPCVSDLEGSTVLPNPEFHQITSLLSGNVTLSQQEDTLSIYASSSERELFAVTNFTSGKPIPYREVMTQVAENDIKFMVNSREFLEALKKISFFLDERSRVELRIEDGILIMMSGNTQGDSKVAVSIDEEENIPDDMTIATNYYNLYSFFNSTNSLLTSIQIKDDKSPIYLTDGLMHRVSVLYYN